MNAPEQFSVRLPLDQLVRSSTNPRTHFDEAKLAELAGTIRKHGVLQPLLVRPMTGDQVAHYVLAAGIEPAVKDIVRARHADGRPTYEIVAGERRYRASLIAEQPDVPVIIKALTDVEVLEIQVIENLQRDDLHPLEEAEGYRRLTRDHEYTVAMLAEKVGKSAEYIFGRMKLLDLSQAARDAWSAGRIASASIALLIARIPHDLQPRAIKEVSEPRYSNNEPMSHRRAAEWIRENYMLPIAKAPFDIKCADYFHAPSNNKNASTALRVIAGPCGACPKRTHAARDLFKDVQGADMCTDPTCYRAKTEAHTARKITEAMAAGQTVIAGKEAKKLLPHTYSGNHIDGYVDPDDGFWAGGNRVNLKKALGRDLPVTLIENPHTGQVLERVNQKDAERLLREKGLLVRRATNEHADKQRALEKKAELETRIRLAILRATLPAVPLDLEALQMVAAHAWGEAGSDNRRRLGQLYEWTKDEVESIEPVLEAMNGTELGGFLVACALVGHCYVNHWSLSNGRPSAQPLLEGTAERAGVDHAAIRAQLVAGAKEKAKTKKPAAQAKAKGAGKKPGPAVGEALKKAKSKAKTEEETPAKAAPKKGGRKGKAAPSRTEDDDPAVHERTAADDLLEAAS